MSKAFTPEFVGELQQFLSAFAALFGKMRIHAKGVRELLQSKVASFIVITSTEEAAFEEALFFDRRVRELGLKVEGFVLNRTYLDSKDAPHPEQFISSDQDDGVNEILRKLKPLAETEIQRIASDEALFRRLVGVSSSSGGDGAVALPYLDETVEDLEALASLSARILKLDRT